MTANNRLMFAGKVELTQMKHISVVPLYGKLLALLVNIRHGRKGLPGTNTLACYKTFVNYGRNFYNIGPWSVVCFDSADFEEVSGKVPRHETIAC